MQFASELTLVSVAGPTSVAKSIERPGPLTIGRSSTNTLQLSDSDRVSRHHAVLIFDAAHESGQWFIVDTNSKHGTHLNGVLLSDGRRYPIKVGDLIEIASWTLHVVGPPPRAPDPSMVPTVDDADSSTSTITNIQQMAEADRSPQLLSLLLRCAETIHSATGEGDLTEAVLEAAVHGTGFANVALLGELSDDGSIHVMGHRGAILSESSPKLSRTLIEQASKGRAVRLSVSMDQPVSTVSVTELGIEEALCVPIMLGAAVTGFLYFDYRRDDSHRTTITSDAADFTMGLGQLTAMAMANLKRQELQRRYEGVESDLAAAAEAQKWVLPKREGRFGSIAYVGESRPGRVVSGDFFDVIPLGDERLALTLGDVVGKGIAASVLMTAAQGFLHAAFTQHGDPARAVTELNSYVSPRCMEKTFLTLWAGVFDATNGTLTYVDAGHGYAVLLRDDATSRQLNEYGGMPIGVEPTCHYEHVPIDFGTADRVVVVSDGLIEQSSMNDDDPSSQFGLAGVLKILGETASDRDEVARIFEALEEHAGDSRLADDATAVLVRRTI